eukprot:1565695-Prymnesium_polylepis.1
MSMNTRNIPYSYSIFKYGSVFAPSLGAHQVMRQESRIALLVVPVRARARVGATHEPEDSQTQLADAPAGVSRLALARFEFVSDRLYRAWPVAAS